MVFKGENPLRGELAIRSLLFSGEISDMRARYSITPSTLNEEQEQVFLWTVVLRLTSGTGYKLFALFGGGRRVDVSTRWDLR
ncbi:hypothetical protein CEXT_684661 [Caerostris extrusa]|uniref:Uncharacterized protein n=1 Tax=Caerostris extrusa TaxID=172846 RepID=A0AAV4XJ20_CAEEX|nr:hypothetical protein CEXT_684661 [Caerostris extrusa]